MLGKALFLVSVFSPNFIFIFCKEKLNDLTQLLKENRIFCMWHTPLSVFFKRPQMPAEKIKSVSVSMVPTNQLTPAPVHILRYFSIVSLDFEMGLLETS